VSIEQPPTASSGRLTVAIDVAPLLGSLTGVGAAVQQLVMSLAAESDIALKPYACSFRGALQPGTTRLPMPAAVAQRLWAHSSVPRMDRWLGPAKVIHGTNYSVPPSRLPRLVTVYDCWFLRNPAQATGDVARAGRVLRRAVDAGAVVHASSNATADAVRELLGTDRVEVIPLAALPISLIDHEPAPPVAELIGVPYVLALGTLERRKNLPRLVAAFGQIASALPDLHLALAGADGDDREAINRAIDGLSASARDRVLFTGRIDDGAKQWLLQHAQLLAYPSLDEGFGFPLLEAMGHRVPVVASTAGSIPEVAGDAAILVLAYDVTALAEALQAALTDSSLRNTLISAGERRVLHYSWSETARRLAEVYRRLAQEATA
jgi:glycosyltransferase involved in cell wall biosynthesis